MPLTAVFELGFDDELDQNQNEPAFGVGRVVPSV